ncbi:MAG: calcium-binding protein [Pseudomonadota bacterium]
MNTNIASLYEFTLQQMAAESYFEGIDLSVNEDVATQLRLGTNRVGYQGGSSDLNEGFPGYTRMTTQQADEFLSKYRIVHQWSDNPTTGSVPGSRPPPEGDSSKPQLNDEILANTGLSATLVRKLDGNGNPTNEYTLAIRSTEFRSWAAGGDGERDKMAADINDIAFKGFSLAQLDALEQYYQWLKDNEKLPANAQLNVTGYSLGGQLATVFTEIHQADIDVQFGQTVTFNGAGRGSFNSSVGSLKDMINYYHEVLNDPRLAPDPGGGIATAQRGAAIGRLGQAFGDKSLYNDERYSWAVTATQLKYGLTFQRLSSEGRTGTQADNRITQVFGYETLNNTNFTANSGIHGPAVRVGVESQPLIEGALNDFGNGHSITLIGDSLALQRAMNQLDVSYTLAKFVSLLPATSNRLVISGANANYEADALETVLDALRRVVFGAGEAKTEFKDGASGFGDITRREGYYANLKTLTESPAFQSLAGKLLIRPTSADLRAAARNDFAAIVALQELSPIWVTGKDAAVDALLVPLWQSTRASDYAAWEADKTAAHPSGFTDSWLADRAAMLQSLIAANTRNAVENPDGYSAVQGTAGGSTNIRYIDLINNKLLQVNNARISPSTALNKYFIFGNESDNIINGGSEVDHLYGGAGNDTLDGKAGNDYLEGGQGTDTYQFSASNWSHDTVVDADGLGQIKLDETILGNAGKWGNSPNVWVDATQTYLIAKIKVSDTRTDLIITRKDKPTEGSITIQNWTANKNLGIVLADSASAPPAADGASEISVWQSYSQVTVGTGSTVAHLADQTTTTPGGNYQIEYTVQAATNGFDSSSSGDSQFIMGSNHAQQISTGSGHDLILADPLGGYTVGGDDVVVSGTGSDIIFTGAGSDFIDAGDGDDFIVVGGVGSIDGSSITDETGTPPNGISLHQGLGPWGTYNDSSNNDLGGRLFVYGVQARQSYLGWSGNPGTAGTEVTDADVVFAGEGNDKVYGGLGDDLLMLEGGNDFALGYIGDDDIVGGSGADMLLGDGLYVSDAYWSAAVLLGMDNLRRIDSGDDLLSGGEGNDVLLGQGGDDMLEGDGGNDDLYGDDADYLTGAYQAALGANGAFAGKDYLDGGGGRDRLVGGGSDDALFGGADDDTLWGDNTVPEALAVADHGEDYLDGEEGNDTLYGGGKNDMLMGGADNDLLYGENGNDTLEGGTGSDLLAGGEGDDTYVFGLGDGLASTNGDAIADAQGSNTLRIDGVALTDIGLKRSSSGQLMVGYGNLAKTVSHGATTVTADNWVTVQDALTHQVIKYLQVNGQSISFAEFVGKNLDAAVSTTTNSDGQQLLGGAVADTLTVQHSDTVVSAGVGNDAITLDGSHNTVQIRNGDGTDTIDGAEPLVMGGNNTVEFGAGIARGDIKLTRGSGGAVVLAAAGADAGVVMTGGIGMVSFADTGEVFTLADLVQAELSARKTGGDDVIEGSVFNDTLNGGAGNDLLLGYEGDDTLVADGGDDILIGGQGNDTYVIGVNAGQVTLLTGLREGDDASVAGNDRIVLAGSKTQTVWTASRSDHSLVLTTQLAGSSTSSSVRLEGYFDSGLAAEAWASTAVEFEDGSTISLQELLAATGQATEADDVIYGRQGGEVINALGGNDTVFALGGDDVVAGGAGDDMLDGGDGNDLLNGDEGQDVLAGGAGQDVLHGSDGDDVLDGGDGNDVLWGDGGDDQLVGDSGADALAGGEGVDLLDGGSGADVLEGDAGNDTLLGGSGDDHLLGGGGADLLKGGAGSDLLEGAEGNDVYVFDVNSLDASRGGEVDVIVDMLGADVIRLDGAAPDTVKVYANADGNFTMLWGAGGVQVRGGPDAVSRIQLEIGGVRSALSGYLVAPPPEEPPVTMAQANANFMARREYETRAQIDYAGSIGALAWRYDAGDALGALMQPVSNDEAWADMSQSSYSETQSPRSFLYNGYKNAQGNYFDSPTYAVQIVEDRFTLSHIEPAYQRILGDGTVVDVPAEYFYSRHVVETTRTYEIPGLTAVSEQRVSYATSYTLQPAASSIDAQLGTSANNFTFSAGLVNAGEGDDHVTANLASFSRQQYSNAGPSGYSVNDHFLVTGGQSEALTRRNEILLTGQAAATWMDGGAGNDTILGSEVSDVLYGGTGFNSLDGNAGPDRYLVLDEGAENPGFSYIADNSVTEPLLNPYYEIYGGIPQELLPPGADIDTVEFGPGIHLNELQFRIKNSQTDTEYFAPTVGAQASSPYLVVERGGRRLAAIELTSDDITIVGRPQVSADAGIEFLEFQDGQKITLATALGMATNQIPPVLISPLADAAAATNQPFNYAIGLHAFEDPLGRPIALTASQADGSPLPSWLQLTFDAARGWVLAGTPAFGNAGQFTVRVTAVTPDGNQVSDELVLSVSSNNTAPVVGEVVGNGEAFGEEPFVWQVPQTAFIDTDVQDSLSWSFTPDDPEAAGWLTFDPVTHVFSGTPTSEYLYTAANGTLTVTDLSGLTATQQIFIWVGDLPGISLTGTEGDDVLRGTRGTDELNGGAGSDVLVGGRGHDSYFVDVSTDKVVEKLDEGYDTVYSTVTYALSGNVEDLILQENAGDIDGRGNLLNNYLEGNEGANKLTGGTGNDTLVGLAGDDRLTGGLGADTMLGGAGDDLYEVDNENDSVIEWADEGADTVEASVTYTLGANVENLILTGTAAIDGSGNELNNVLQGNIAANTLTAGAGNDTLNGRLGLDILIGGLGNDTYLFEDDLDTIEEEADGGRDTLISRISAATLAANVEDGILLGSAVALTGNELTNVLTGNNAANILDGGAGADVLIGGKGNDLYIVGSQADTVVENAAEGSDTIESSVSYSLGDNVEHLTLTGAAEAGMGNELNNKLTGNTASNKLWGGLGNDGLDGGVGADILFGGLGNDKYWVDSSDDLVVENAGEGTDTVYASVSYALADNVERLTLTGSANINAVGNALNNRLEGNTGNNVLFGGLGNDTYVWGRGSGQDVVANFDAGKPSGDMVQLGADIAEADLGVARQGNDLILSINGTSDQLTVANYFENAGKGANALEKIRFADGTSWNHAAVLSRTTAQEGASSAQMLPPELLAGNPTALFDAPDPAQTQTNDTTTAPQSVAESIAAAKERFEQGLQNLTYSVDEQGSLSRSEFAERRALPLLWNLQDALLNLQLAKNPDGRFTADISIDSRATRDLGLSITVLGGAAGTAGQLGQVARPQEIQQFDLAQMQ